MRDDGCGSKKNQSLVAYDITSLEYKQTLAGQVAKYDDAMSKYMIDLCIYYGDYQCINGP